MAIAAVIIAGLALCAATVVALAFLVSSIHERERRASVVAAVLFGITALLSGWFAIHAAGGGFAGGTPLTLLWCAIALAVSATLLLTLPLGKNPAALQGTAGLKAEASVRWDERDTVFSLLRKRTADQPQPFNPPINLSPEKFDDPLEFADDDWPREPGTIGHSISDELLPSLDLAISNRTSIPVKGRIDGSGAVVAAAMSRACSIAVEHMADPRMLYPATDEQQTSMLPDEAAKRVKGFTRHLGAVLVGITEINPLWLYSNRGSSSHSVSDWGQQIPADYSHAIVFAEEMDQPMVDSGPHTPAMVETMVNYAKGSFIASQLATFIAGLGYRAKADQMEHYDSLMVPLAVDAGLGELSRMGYLITKEYGPRVRLDAVLTDLPLQTDSPVDIGVADFCSICKKCAHCCPSQSIPSGDRKAVNGYLKWKMDAGSCINYWRQVGTDCSICMRVCPWSHARTWPHRLITELVSRNAISRRLFNWLDDVFYGRRPKAKPAPEWIASMRTGAD